MEPDANEAGMQDRDFKAPLDEPDTVGGGSSPLGRGSHNPAHPSPSDRVIPVGELEDGVGWIYVVGWDDRQQFRKDRPDWRPPWCRLYRDNLRRDEYLDLSLAARGLLHGIEMLVTEDGNGRVAYRMRTLRNRIGITLKPVSVLMISLVQAGFLEIHSRQCPDNPSTSTSRGREDLQGGVDLAPGERIDLETGEILSPEETGPVPQNFAAPENRWRPEQEEQDVDELIAHHNDVLARFPKREAS